MLLKVVFRQTMFKQWSAGGGVSSLSVIVPVGLFLQSVLVFFKYS